MANNIEFEKVFDPNASIKLDTTLSQEGEAADAKAVGNALGGKVSVTDIVDNTTTEDATKPLSAKQGKAIKGIVDRVSTEQTAQRQRIDGLENKSLDKVLLFDFTNGDNIYTFIDGYGIYWENGKTEIVLETPDGTDSRFTTGESRNRVPIVAGDGITFEIFDNNVVRINADVKSDSSGGSTTELKDIITSVTYSELKALRDSSKLTPGMFYRITDYVCTTAQPDTRAMGNKFDIILQALSNNTLSENAKADYHVEVIGDGGSGSNSSGGNYAFKSDVLADEDGSLVQGAVVAHYYIFEDVDESQGAPHIGTHEGYKHTDLFIAYGYEENNDGVTVPVIYKTDWEKTQDDPEYENPDYEDVFYYVGTAELNGTTYDKWRKINVGVSMPHWEDDPLYSNEPGKIYVLTNVVIENAARTYIFDSSVINSDGTLVDGAVTSYYKELVDYDDEQYPEKSATSLLFIAYDYLKNNDGNTVPVMYSDYEDDVDKEQPFYYVGREIIDGVEYDKWRKIEFNANPDEMDFGWDNVGKYYIYTNIIVKDGSIKHLANANVPSWELKYCLDNDTTRFAWADEETGKGVIYYMKDEHGNECPYDFKNIQFKRMVSLENGYPELDEENGEETWVYTFCGNSYHIDNDEWSALKDGSLESPYGHQSDENTSTFHHNVMKPYILFFDIENEDYTVCGKQYLNNNVFFGYWEEVGSTNEENSYYAANCCYFNTLDGNNCYSNTFGNNCYSNTLGNNCYSNTLGNYCTYNTLGNNCYSNTFGNNCYSNTLEIYCDSNKIPGDINYIHICKGVSNKTLTPEPYANYEQIYRLSGSKEILV